MTITTLHTAGDYLEAVADIIDTEGWTQGVTAEYREFPGGHRELVGRCMLGGMIAVRKRFSPDTSEDQDEYWRIAQLEVLAREAVRKEIGTRHIGMWNDKNYRTKDEVIATLRNAARTVADVTVED